MDLVDDLKLMFNNAMHYNQEGSLIYNVNIQIRKLRNSNV